MDSGTFRNYYYLKEELTDFCRRNGLPASGGKMELTDRIAAFLDTGCALPATGRKRPASSIGLIAEDTRIEPDLVCSERHRAFFREKLGERFSFNVAFQKWLKANSGKTYGDAIAAYAQILAEKKTGKTTIGKQFEYNAYIRAFFEDNAGKTLAEAIACWNYKKSLQGHNRYERTDLIALQ